MVVPSFLGNLTYFNVAGARYFMDRAETIGLEATVARRPLTYKSFPVLDVWPVWIVLWGGPKWLYLLAVAQPDSSYSPAPS